MGVISYEARVDGGPQHPLVILHTGCLPYGLIKPGLLDRFAELDGVGLQLYEGVDVVLVRVVDELDLRQPVHERGVAAARRHVRARERLRLRDEGVREVAHATLLAQRPGLLDEVQAERAEVVLHLVRVGASGSGSGSASGWCFGFGFGSVIGARARVRARARVGRQFATSAPGTNESGVSCTSEASAAAAGVDGVGAPPPPACARCARCARCAAGDGGGGGEPGGGGGASTCRDGARGCGCGEGCGCCSARASRRSSTWLGLGLGLGSNRGGGRISAWPDASGSFALDSLH